MIRYLLFPNKVAPKEEAATETVRFNTPLPVNKSTDSGLKKSRKLASNCRKLKTPASKGENSRKKLQFNPLELIDHTGTSGLENDSENLFIETTQSRKWNDGKIIPSYLEQQPAIAEINDLSVTKAKKRKSDDATDQSVDKVRRAKKKKSDSDTSSVENETVGRRSTKKINNLKIKSESCSPDLQNQGEFLGFVRSDMIESFNKLETMLNCLDKERYATDTRPRASNDKRINVEILCATGEAKEQNVTVQETKINSMLDAVKSTVGEMKSDVKIENALASGRDVDTEELDLNVWKNNDKNEKRKRLFKSVKERNKKDVSISDTLNSLMDRNKFTPKENTRSKLDLSRSKIQDLQNGPTKDQTKIDEKKLKKATPSKASQEKKNTRKEPSPEHVEIPKDEKENKKPSQETERIRKEPSPDIFEISKDEKVNETPSQQTKRDRKESSLDIVEIPKDEKINKTPSQHTKRARQKLSPEIVEIPKDERVTSQTPSKGGNKRRKESSPDIVKISKQSPQKIDSLQQTASTARATEIPTEASSDPINAPQEPLPKQIPSKSIEILTNNSSVVAEKSTSKPPSTDSPQMLISVSAETSKTPRSSKLSEKWRNTGGRLGLPLFSEMNDDIFSQKDSICSSTPCGMKKVVKTYSRNKSNLFNRSIAEISPITEQDEISPNDSSRRSFSGNMYSPEVPKDVESESLADHFSANTPIKISNLRCKIPETSDILKTQIVVHAEVHEVPVNPSLLSTKTPVKVKVNSAKDQSPTKNGIFCKSDPVEKIIATDIDEDVDKVIETVDKIAKEVFQQTSRNVMIEESQSPIPTLVDERKARANKVKKLQESINVKNEKSLSDLKRNFHHVSPKLAVKKVKSITVEPPQSPSPSLLEKVENNYVIEPIESTTSPKYSRPESSFYDETIPTQKPCTPSRNVACQTTPDLHLALLKQEFPHLFEKYDPKSDFPLSVYDTPIEQKNDAPPLVTKTPDVSLLNASAKYTVISSVTSSEKKFAEKHFANDSIICNSPFSVGSANKTNVSGYAPLSPDRNTGTSKKLSCRLNFDDELSLETVIEKIPDCVTSNENIPSADPRPTDEPDRSKEIQFSDSVDDKMQEICEQVEQEEMVGSVSILENQNISNITVGQIIHTEDGDKTFFEGDSLAILSDEDTNGDKRENTKGDITIREVVSDTEDIAAYGMNQEKELTDDEDEIDFVAGTPTTQPRRLFTNTLEKIRTPCNPLRKPPDVSLNEFSICENTTPTVSFIQPLTDVSQYSVTKKPSQAEVTHNGETEHKDESDKISIELFNSGVSNSMSFESIHVTTSGLKEADIKIIKKFCDKFSASYLDKLTDKSTHLIVKTDEKNRTARTFKYLQAIVSGVRIVSMKWIQECLSKDKIVSEEKYIPLDSSGECGPLRTYNVVKAITPSPLSWLRDYCVYFTEPVPRECTLEQLQHIMQKAGATVIDSLKEFKKYPNNHRIIIVSEEDENDDATNIRIAGWLQSYQAVSVEFNWILEVIGRNKLVPFADFEVVEIPNEYLLRLNFPPEMLQSDEEDQNSD